MENKNEGMCRFCLRTFAGSAMGRHLLACKVKKERDEQEAAHAQKKYPIFYIKVSGSKYYWLHIEMKGTAKLADLDSFLRNIWLECCGHLSSFTINRVEYQDTTYEDDWDNLWGGREVRPTTTTLSKVLNVGDKFDYAYDFGTTTYLEGKVLGVREGVLKKPVRILARNSPYTFECEECGKQATDICMECGSFFCEQCLANHECGDEMALPVVNSPRMGVCGYTGDYDFDDFSI